MNAANMIKQIKTVIRSVAQMSVLIIAGVLINNPDYSSVAMFEISHADTVFPLRQPSRF